MLRVIVWVIAFLMVLQVLHLDIGPAIVSLGFLGLALSLVRRAWSRTTSAAPSS